MFVLARSNEVLRETARQNPGRTRAEPGKNLGGPPPLDSLGSVKRFVYAALLSCTSDNCRHQLRNTRSSAREKGQKKLTTARTSGVSCRVPCRFSFRPRGTTTAAYLLDLLSVGWLCCAFLSLSAVRGRHLEF